MYHYIRSTIYSPILYGYPLYKQTIHNKRLTDIINLSTEKSFKLFVETNKKINKDNIIKKNVYDNSTALSIKETNQVISTAKHFSNLYLLLYLGIGSLSLFINHIL